MMLAASEVAFHVGMCVRLGSRICCFLFVKVVEAGSAGTWESGRVTLTKAKLPSKIAHQFPCNASFVKKGKDLKLFLLSQHMTGFLSWLSSILTVPRKKVPTGVGGKRHMEWQQGKNLPREPALPSGPSLPSRDNVFPWQCLPPVVSSPHSAQPWKSGFSF